MKAYFCDHCRRQLRSKEEGATNIHVHYGMRAVESEGKYGDKTTTICLCTQCTEKLRRWLGGIFFRNYPDIEASRIPVDYDFEEVQSTTADSEE